MSYDLIFWRGQAGEEPSATFHRLNRGDSIAGVQELSVEEVRAAFREEFPDLKERGPELRGFLGPGFDIALSAPPIRLVFVCCAWGLLKEPEILEKIKLAGYTRLRCHLYNPQVNEFRENASGRGDVLLAQGNLPAALDAYKAALAIRKSTGDAGWQKEMDLSITHGKIGDVLRAQGNLPAARHAYKAALAIAERHAEAYPSDAGCQQTIALGQARIGDVLLAQGDLPAARHAFQASLAIRERLAKAEPENPELQYDVARSLCLMGYAAEKQGCLDEAMAHYRRGLEIVRRLTTLAPDHAAFKRQIAWFEKRIAQL
jgi:tetratricopeptide (TPR) repeat protein